MKSCLDVLCVCFRACSLWRRSSTPSALRLVSRCRASPSIWRSEAAPTVITLLLWLLFTCANPSRHVLYRWWSSLMWASCLEAGHPSCGTTFWPMNPGWATNIIIKIIITWPWWCARVSVSEFSVQPFWLLRTWRSSVTRLGPPGASSPRSSAGSFPPSLVKASTRSSWACWEKNSSVYIFDFFLHFRLPSVSCEGRELILMLHFIASAFKIIILY